MQIRCPGCVPRNYIQLWYSFISLETKRRSPNRSWKIICSDFRLTAQQGFRGPYFLAPYPNWAFHMSKSTASSRPTTLVVKLLPLKALSLRICTERSYYPGLREYLSGWVDLNGKHPSPRSFTCWCFGPWVVWSHVHFVSWLVTGFMILSWSVWWTYPESLLFNVNFLRKQQTPNSTCKCELVTSLVCLVAG
jgi:hypothetical protein